MNYKEYRQKANENERVFAAATQALIEAKAGRMEATENLKYAEANTYDRIKTAAAANGVRLTEAALEAKVTIEPECVEARAAYREACEVYETAKRDVMIAEMQDKNLRGYDTKLMTRLDKITHAFSWPRNQK